MNPLNKALASLNRALSGTQQGNDAKPGKEKSTVDHSRDAAAAHVRDQMETESTKNILNESAKHTAPKLHAPLSPSGSGSISSPSKKTASPAFPKDPQSFGASSIQFGAKEIHEMLNQLSSAAFDLAGTCGLTPEETAAIHAYTHDEYYQAINNQFRTLPLDGVDISDAKALKNAGVKNTDLAELIAAMVRGMKKLPPAQTSDSYFMCLGRNVTMPDDELKRYEEGKEVSTPTFLSTTISQPEMVRDLWWDNKDHALFIHQIVNGNARDISAFSRFDNEKEILFLPNTKFKVTFRGEPTETEAGVPSAGPANARAGSKTRKLLIALQEIPSADKARAKKTGASKNADKVISDWDRLMYGVKPDKRP